MRGLAILLLLLTAGLSTHSVCDFMFDCGCLPPGLGGVEHCNIHEPRSPDCPWCKGGLFVQGVTGVIFLLGMGGGVGWGLRRRARPWVIFVAGGAGYLVAAVVGSLVAALMTGYPTWIGIPL